MVDKRQELRILLGTMKLIADRVKEIIESEKLNSKPELLVFQTDMELLSAKLSGLEQYATITPDDILNSSNNENCNIGFKVEVYNKDGNKIGNGYVVLKPNTIVDDVVEFAFNEDNWQMIVLDNGNVIDVGKVVDVGYDEPQPTIYISNEKS